MYVRTFQTDSFDTSMFNRTLWRLKKFCITSPCCSGIVFFFFGCRGGYSSLPHTTRRFKIAENLPKKFTLEFKAI